VIGLTPVLTFLVGGSNSQVTDVAGVVWQTRSIAESMATVSLYTMVFAAVLAGLRLLQDSVEKQSSRNVFSPAAKLNAQDAQVAERQR
jgi:hypothetical protein